MFIAYNKSEYREKLKDGIQLNHTTRHSNFSEKSIETLQPRLIEICEILVESLELYEDQLRKLDYKKTLVSKLVRQIIKTAVINHPGVFDSKECCPCYSGKKFGECCGKATRK